MIGTHQIPDQVFARLSATHGGPEGIEVLRRARGSTLTLLLTEILAERARATEAVELLVHMERTAPAGTADLLLYPWIGAWLAGALVRPWSPEDDNYLAGIAVAAAIRAGEPVPRSLRAGRPPLRLEVPSIGVSEGATPGPIPGPGWMPVHQVDIGGTHAGARVTIDDVDRHRFCFELPMSGRLADAEVTRWRDRLTGAFDLLAAHAPGRHQELVAGLRAIAPLDHSATRGRSATHRYAFGGFAAGLPETDAELAAIAVHEFQHSKLNALMDVVKLCEPGRPERYFAPWRADPRPLSGLLHGTYSFAAMAGFWDALRTNPALEARATTQAADYRAQVLRVLRDLGGAPGLTGTGRAFVRGISAEMTNGARPLPAVAERQAERRLERIEQRWKLRQTGG